VLTGGVSVLLTIPAAALSERWVERPGIALGRALTGWMRPQRRPVPALAAGAAGGR
jgi:peptidoglycan/LPS O-acetylase OafA/YrhL